MAKNDEQDARWDRSRNAEGLDPPMRREADRKCFVKEDLDQPRGGAADSKRPRASSCSHCGAQHVVRLRKRPGRTLPYRTLPALPLPEDVALRSCSRCKAEFLDKSAREALAPLLTRLYAAELRRRIQNAIAALSAVVSQRWLEHRLGLSAGYLSRLKAGAGTPSPPLVLLLQQIALDPIARLREVERLWGEPSLLDPPGGIATKASAPEIDHDATLFPARSCSA